MTADRTLPLTGVTVPELGSFLAAPFAARQLADLGAEVIKVEHPAGGDPVRHKRSVALDLKAPDARPAFLRRSGLMSITGHPGGPPAKVGVPICDLVGGLYVALAVTAALRERDHSGAGQYIDLSLFEAGVSFAVWEAGTYFATGEVGGPMGSAHQSNAPYQAVHSSDGYVTIGATTPRNWQAFCEALRLTRLLDDPRYADAFSRLRNRAGLIATIEAVTSTMSTAEIVERLNEAGVPCAPIADYGDVFTDEHLTARGFFWDAAHPTAGPVRQLGSPMRLSETPVRRAGAGPVLGADTRDLLLNARFYSGPEAHTAGFVAECVDDLDEAVTRTVDRLAGHAPLTMWATKEAIRRLRRGTPAGDDIVARVYGSADFGAAVKAFSTKQATQWTGR